MVADECLIPTTNCNAWYLQANDTQKYILIQLLLQAASALGQLNSTDMATVKTLASAWFCQGGPENLRLIQAQKICATITADCTQPVCWTPEELEGAMTYAVCHLANGVANPGPA